MSSVADDGAPRGNDARRDSHRRNPQLDSQFFGVQACLLSQAAQNGTRRDDRPYQPPRGVTVAKLQAIRKNSPHAQISGKRARNVVKAIADQHDRKVSRD